MILPSSYKLSRNRDGCVKITRRLEAYERTDCAAMPL